MSRPRDTGPIQRAARGQFRRLGLTAEDEPLLYALAVKLAGAADRTESARHLPSVSRELRSLLADVAVAATKRPAVPDEIDEMRRRWVRRRPAPDPPVRDRRKVAEALYGSGDAE